MSKRILCIDGGGIKGAFPASFLAQVEEARNVRVADYFDLIVGVSTGGILALGLSLRIPAHKLLEFYERDGEEIFGGNRILAWPRQWIRAKYRRGPLKQALDRVFGSQRLADSKTRLVIPAANLETGEVYVYKTAHHARLEVDFKESMVDVALATSAAPTYFPAYAGNSGIPLVDGGIWANNPIAVAAVEALAVLEWATDSVDILSLSCTSAPLDIKHGRRIGLGRIYWAPRVTDLFTTMQSQSALGMACLLLGDDHVLRIDPKVPGKRFKLDGVKEIGSLIGLGKSEARKALPKLKERFFHRTADAFVPFHKLP